MIENLSIYPVWANEMEYIHREIKTHGFCLRISAPKQAKEQYFCNNFHLPLILKNGKVHAHIEKLESKYNVFKKAILRLNISDADPKLFIMGKEQIFISVDVLYAAFESNREGGMGFSTETNNLIFFLEFQGKQFVFETEHYDVSVTDFEFKQFLGQKDRGHTFRNWTLRKQTIHLDSIIPVM